MPSFWNSEITEIFRFTPISTNKCSWVVKIIDLTRLTPEIFGTLKFHFSKPILLCLWTVLRIELTRIDQEVCLHLDQFLNIPLVVKQLITREGYSNCWTAHLKNWHFGTVWNMNHIIDSINLTTYGEIVDSRLLNRIPIIPENTSIVRVSITWYTFDIGHHWGTNITFLVVSEFFFGENFPATLLKSCNLWHVAIIKNV